MVINLANARLTDEELKTSLVKAEHLINSRPLTVSAGVDDLQPLTPQHFLTGRLDPSLALQEVVSQ